MSYYVNVANQILIFSVFAVSLNLLVGYAGQISVAHAGFGAVGGYSAGYLALNHGTPFWLAVVIGMVLAAVVGGIVAGPALRLSPEYLILLTIAVSTIITTIVSSVRQLGGTYGLLGIPQATVFGRRLATPEDYLPLFAVVALAVYLLCRRIGESPYGRVLRGIRDDPVATRSLGKNVLRYKVVVFAVTSGLAGLAGALLAFYNQLASPGAFGFDTSLAIFVMVILGGIGNLAGSVLGATVITLAQPLLEKVLSISPERASLWKLLLYGAGLVLLMRLRPQGLLPEGVHLGRLLRPRPAPAARPTTPESTNGHVPVGAVRAVLPPDPGQVDSVVQVRGLAKSFGGIHAVQDLSLDLQRGRVTALVGPNGAGKTTVFNLLTGAFRPDAGSVKLNGADITGMRPDLVAALGMVRSYQDVRVFGRLSALQNVAAAVQDQAGERLVPLFFQPGRVAAGERAALATAREWLGFVGLADQVDLPAASLSFGQQKLVALARALATEAPVLLLDEPASGIDGRWVDVTLELIGRLRDGGKTICIVEHSLHVVEQLADTTYFMELGTVTAQGQLAELLNQDRLAEAYFGTV